jgi:hypothetical protein
MPGMPRYGGFYCAVWVRMQISDVSQNRPAISDILTQKCETVVIFEFLRLFQCRLIPRNDSEEELDFSDVIYAAKHYPDPKTSLA